MAAVGMEFDLVVTNPPFQDSDRRGKTPHKLWIEFADRALNGWLRSDGILAQVVPASVVSPSSKVLHLLRKTRTLSLSFHDTSYFPNVALDFADFVVQRRPVSTEATVVDAQGESFLTRLDDVLYLPNDLDSRSLSIHRKVMFVDRPRFSVLHDYVTCHNVLLRRDGSLSRHRTSEHVYPVMHTNRQIWWSTRRQQWASVKKVIWSRSGYTLPVFDAGRLGGTDMIYYIPVESDEEGEALARLLNGPIYQYIFKTARWSGFGNERVFARLPQPPRDIWDDAARLAAYFELTEEELDYAR